MCCTPFAAWAIASKNPEKMTRKSLAFRLIASSAAIALVLLLAAAVLLNSLFHQALERNFDERLRAVLDGIIANVEVNEEGMPSLTSPIADTRFSLPQSGWYWQVAKPGGDETQIITSESLLEKRLRPSAVDLAGRDAEGIATFYMTDDQKKQLRAIEQKFKLFGSKDDYSFIVAGNFDELRAEVSAFRRILFGTLALLGLGLMLATLFQVRFGLSPMKDMTEKLNAIRSGKSEFLEGKFPDEMQPVADEMNLVIKTGFEILERARTQVGNLAHALKTPLSVLSNEASANPSPLATKVAEQTAVMRDHVNLYLDRARRAAQAGTLGATAEVAPVIAGLARTLQRIYKDKDICIRTNVPDAIRFRGERQDLEEMVGNLMENASKWCVSEVEVSLSPAESKMGRRFIQIIVDDDGPGIPPDKRAIALQRGKRLDETKPGSGLGLNIVAETSAMYGGNISLETSTLGGLRVKLALPSVAD
jgi:signal transduction histidine kinase